MQPERLQERPLGGAWRGKKKRRVTDFGRRKEGGDPVGGILAGEVFLGVLRIEGLARAGRSSCGRFCSLPCPSSSRKRINNAGAGNRCHRLASASHVPYCTWCGGSCMEASGEAAIARHPLYQGRVLTRAAHAGGGAASAHAADAGGGGRGRLQTPFFSSGGVQPTR